jgi:hypothetical protein
LTYAACRFGTCKNLRAFVGVIFLLLKTYVVVKVRVAAGMWKPPVKPRHSPFHIGCLAMHHIYAESKKEEIERLSGTYNITGLYLYGKPGRVVFEGLPDDVTRYDRGVRKMHWQKCKFMGRVVVLNAVETAATDEQVKWERESTVVGIATECKRIFDKFEEVRTVDELSQRLLVVGLQAVNHHLSVGFSNVPSISVGHQ